MSTIDYAAEKLWSAVHELALGRGPIKERLADAAQYVAMAAGAKHDLADFRAEYEATLARLTAVAAEGTEGAIGATIHQMSESEACDIANQILTLAYKAKAASEQERAQKGHGSAKDAVREAVRRLASSPRAYFHNVPLEAERILKESAQGTLTTGEASGQVKRAIGEMVQNGELDAPIEPFKDWKLLK